MQFIDTAADPCLRSIDALPNEFDAASDADVRAMIEKIRAAATAGLTKTLHLLEQTLGIKHEPIGVLFDPACSGRVCPVTGWLRDWMHALVGGGWPT